MNELKRFVFLIPTYNEADSIVELIKQLEEFRNSSHLNFDLVVIDDNSPDRTADIVAAMSINWITILRRPEKKGLGAAYRAGFMQVLQSEKYTHVVTMDADGSHRVADLPAMISGVMPGRSITLGTRWITGGSVVNWPKYRELLSKAGTRYAKFTLQLDLNDLTGGFRIYSVELLKALQILNMDATGYCFQIEMAMAAVLAGAVATEVPITFVERANGVSKMTKAIVIESLIQTSRWGLARRIKRNADKLHYVK
jgi:dolichol-phosphate mannosyltransferase